MQRIARDLRRQGGDVSPILLQSSQRSDRQTAIDNPDGVSSITSAIQRSAHRIWNDRGIMRSRTTASFSKDRGRLSGEKENGNQLEYGNVIPSCVQPQHVKFERNETLPSDGSEQLNGGARKRVATWNRLNVILFVAYSLAVAAVSVPITLIPIISTDVSRLYAMAAAQMAASGSEQNEDLYQESEASFASKMASSAILGGALGKFVHGQAGDVFGARRILSLYTLLVSISLFALSWASHPSGVLWWGAMVEFFQAVQWPCLLILLASHYCDHGDYVSGSNEFSHCSEEMYEVGVNIVSLASRVGAAIAIPLSSILLRHTFLTWRQATRWGAFLSLLSSMVYFFYVRDAPRKTNDPINPPPPVFYPIPLRRIGASNCILCLHASASNIQSIGRLIVIPSFTAIVCSSTFWIVALAHVGGSIIRASERLLGTYFENTSDGRISRFQSGGYSVIMSFGVIAGLSLWGGRFVQLASSISGPRKRISMIKNMYCMAVVMCLLLSFISLPWIRRWWPSWFIWSLEVFGSFMLAASLAVPYFHIPAIVASTYERNKGMYVSYNDGFGLAVSSVLLRIFGTVVQSRNPEEGGWAYFWTAIAVVVVISGSIMYIFMSRFLFTICHPKRPSSAVFDPTTSDVCRRSASNHAGAHSSGDDIRKRPNSLQFAAEFTAKSSGMSNYDLLLFESDHLRRDNGDRNSSDRARAEACLRRSLEEVANQYCCDCPNPLPRWVAIIAPIDKTNFDIMGCFVCQDCASAHRSLGVHISFVRSVDHDSLKEQEVKAVINGGNERVNAVFESTLVGLDREKKVSLHPSDSKARHHFIIDKYKKRTWCREVVRNYNRDNEKIFADCLNHASLMDMTSFDSEDDYNEGDSSIELGDMSLSLPDDTRTLYQTNAHSFNSSNLSTVEKQCSTMTNYGPRGNSGNGLNKTLVDAASNDVSLSTKVLNLREGTSAVARNSFEITNTMTETDFKTLANGFNHEPVFVNNSDDDEQGSNLEEITFSAFEKRHHDEQFRENVQCLFTHRR